MLLSFKTITDLYYIGRNGVALDLLRSMLQIYLNY